MSISLPPITKATSGIPNLKSALTDVYSDNEGDDDSQGSDADEFNPIPAASNTQKDGNSPGGARPRSRTVSVIEPLALPKKKKDKNKQKIYEIDYVGTGTFQPSQLNLLNKRSIEPIRSTDALLSARGLHHRSADVFVREVHNATNIINGMMRGEKVTSSKYKPSPQLFQPHLTRALAYERLHKIDQAIEDYGQCLRIDPKCSIAYFNRANLYKLKKQYTTAINDLNEAVRLEPANIEYRTARSILFRESGHYGEAVKDTLLTRALQREPNIARTLELGSEVALDSDLVYAMKIAEDPIITALAIPGAQRTNKDIEPILDFLTGLKFFYSFQSNYEVMSAIARKVELQSYSKNRSIFQEGDVGNHFYIILDGEVSIVKVKKVFDEVIDTTVLVRMFRGQTFGETALESKGGLRTAGAISTQKCKLLALHAEDYLTILSRFRTVIKEEVRTILSSSSIFQDWETAKLDYLASFAIMKNYAANSEILKAGDPVSSLMLIKSGIVQLIKSIPKPDISAIMRKTANNTVIVNENYSEVPGLWVLNKNWNHHLDDHLRLLMPNDFVEFTVGVLGSGQVFGELALLDPEKPSPVTAVSSTAVELYCFESDVLLMIGARFNATTMKSLHESLTLHDPPADKIAYYYRSKYSWEVRKNRLMNRLGKKDG